MPWIYREDAHSPSADARSLGAYLPWLLPLDCPFGWPFGVNVLAGSGSHFTQTPARQLCSRGRPLPPLQN